MAPFNKRQIGYIQAIAGRQQHVSLTAGQHNILISSGDTPDWKLRPQTLQLVNGNTVDSSSTANTAKSLMLYNWLLDEAEVGFDSRGIHNNARLDATDLEDLSDTSLGFGNNKVLHTFDAPVTDVTYTTSATDPLQSHEISAVGYYEQNPRVCNSTYRLTADGYLNSTTVKFRFTLPRDIPGAAHATDMPMGSDHYEFRWIVWRSKRPTYGKSATSTASHESIEAIRDGKSFRNPGYDFFKGQTGRKRGFLGYTHHPEFDQDSDLKNGPSERYSGKYYKSATSTTAWQTGPTTPVDVSGLAPEMEQPLTVDDLMTLPINKDDYVVMKDVRFFLGRQQGKSHFEDSVHWDWNDPIDTPHVNVLTSPTLNDKNYRWHMTILGTSGGKSTCALNASVRWTTKMESG